MPDSESECAIEADLDVCKKRKKGVHRPMSYKVNRIKKARIHGHYYVNYKGNIVEAQKTGMPCTLYTETEYSSMCKETPPEMQRSELSGAILQLKALGIDNVLRFSFPSPPPARTLLAALELLHALEALTSSGALTTPLGLHMAEFPLSPLHAKALLISGEYGCSEEMSSILSLLQVQNVFLQPFGANAIKARVERRKFEVREGDLLTLLNVYASYQKVIGSDKSSKAWCHARFVNHKAMKRVTEIRKQMLNLLTKFDVPVVSCNGDTQKVCQSIAAGFFSNAAYLHHSGVYKTVRGNMDLYIHPTSVLYSIEQPQWVLFCEIIQTDRAYMRELTVVESDWLINLAPHFYHKTTERDF